MRKQVILLVVLILLGAIYPQFTQAQGGSSYAVIDAKTGRLLAGSGEHQRLPIASLTKMWTAVIVTDEVNIKEDAEISTKASSQEGSSIYLKAGVDTPVDVLLYGLMLRSGNDASVALAEHVGGSVDGFVKLMNEKAILMGMKDTKFQNPSGLHHEEQFSSAYDTALMLKIAMENKELKTILSTTNYKQNGIYWENKHKLVRLESTAIAGKTGYTKAAGRTLATYFKDGEKEVIVVTLNQSNDWQMHKQLAQNVFTQYDRVQVIQKGSYDLPGGLIIKTNQPAYILKKKNEQVSHLVFLNRTKALQKNARWEVQLNGKTILTQNVHIERNE
ncbi:D-alanyl-D-alanine carboxypeptidase family protein [Paenisporosarcina antarctica]|uniref:D-alanyl-D-alanine carboxypeptidase n=1 Tax=Paenisporosarcina antarctica TaxID=417367 RepID=A0A4P6ZYH5_9BACL|nr:D-alanyl-D-alanine carboxypeptidase family protein [Paenisporosarcina antarctica]QBP41373.1 D-alanyl-D-alanine carboxypeptidase [Paenisporosarcina antarctica]